MHCFRLFPYTFYWFFECLELSVSHHQGIRYHQFHHLAMIFEVSIKWRNEGHFLDRFGT
jgi:hypothetical protein